MTLGQALPEAPPRRALVLGAGIAGLSCARALRAAGWAPLVVERSRGVGGRCATRRIEGQPVDHGVAFLHGRSPGFRRALEVVRGARRLEPWPRTVVGAGTPCQRDAFEDDAVRVAFDVGVSAFAKELASGVDVALGAEVARLVAGDETIDVHFADARPTITAEVVVVALAPAQSARLLHDSKLPTDDLRAVSRLLERAPTRACLTAILRYPKETAPPEFDLALVGGGRLHLISADSKKRSEPASTVLVAQASPRFSAEAAAAPPAAWAAALVEDVVAFAGAAFASPRGLETHRWKYARLDGAPPLARPMLVSVGKRALLGVTGEFFDPAGGVEGAFEAGRRLAAMLIERNGR